MIYLAAGFSFLVGVYAMPFVIAMFKSNFTLKNLSLFEKIQNAFVLLLVGTFPLVNFSSAIEILFFRSYTCSYISACYGVVFITFWLLDMIMSYNERGQGV